MLYTGLCHTDVLVGRAIWGETIFPIAPGHEIIGEVSQVGSEVSDFKKGDIVGFGTIRYCCNDCKNFKKDHEELCLGGGDHYTYGRYWGGYATGNSATC